MIKTTLFDKYKHYKIGTEVKNNDGGIWKITKIKDERYFDIVCISSTNTSDIGRTANSMEISWLSGREIMNPIIEDSPIFLVTDSDLLIKGWISDKQGVSELVSSSDIPLRIFQIKELEIKIRTEEI